MGNEGGFIPKRIELVKTVQKEKKADKDDALKAKWNNCTLCKQPLTPPLAADFLGRLYSKDEVIKYLLEKKPLAGFEHLKKLKDLITLNVTVNPKMAQSKLGSVADLYEGDSSQFLCPITSLPMNGRHRFSFLATCGCVFSEKALKEVPSPTCLSCGKPFTQDDVIPIYGDEAEVQKLREKMEAANPEKSSDKKSKKRKETPDDAPSEQREPKKLQVEGSETFKSLFKPADHRPTKSNLYMGTFNFYPGQS